MAAKVTRTRRIWALSWVGVAFGLLWLALAVVASFRYTGRDGRIDAVRQYWDVMALPGSELSLPMIVVAAIVLLVLLAVGAHRSRAGGAGVALTLAAVALLALSLARAGGEPGRIQRTLEAGLGAGFLDEIPPDRRTGATAPLRFSEWARPLNFDTQGIETIADIPYGAYGERNQLDLLRAADNAGTGRPVLLHMHGGGYAFGRKNLSALPLLHRMARAGWVVVTINYRLAPEARWPAPLVDAKLAVAWIRQHIAEYGGDPAFIVATGGSAGGNLSLFLALTAGERDLQPGFEDVDTRIQAAVPYYAGLEDYDFANLDDLLVNHLRNNVLPAERRDDPAAWAELLPATFMHAAAPPVLIVTGTHDALALIEGARQFAARLQAVSQSPVLLAEVHGGFHGFDDTASLRTLAVARGVHQFLEYVHARWRSVTVGASLPAAAGGEMARVSQSGGSSRVTR